MKTYNLLNDNYIVRLNYEKEKKRYNLMVEICHSIILMIKADVRNVFVLSCLLNAKHTTAYEEFIQNFINGTAWTWLDERFDEIIQSNKEMKFEDLFTKLLEDTTYEQKTSVWLLQHFFYYILHNKIILGSMVKIFDEYNEKIIDVWFDYYKANVKFKNAQKTQL